MGKVWSLPVPSSLFFSGHRSPMSVLMVFFSTQLDLLYEAVATEGPKDLDGSPAEDTGMPGAA